MLKAQGSSKPIANRYLALIRAILRCATQEWEWLDRTPTITLYPEPNRRVRWLTREQAERLLAELPTHLEAMARFSLATGLRQSNVTGLTWEQIDLARAVAWIHPDQAKGKRAIPVALNAEALTVIRAQIGRHPVYAFILDMVLRYAHLGAEHLAEHAERIARPRAIRTNYGAPKENALPQVKKEAHTVIGPNTADSVARFIAEREGVYIDDLLI